MQQGCSNLQQICSTGRLDALQNLWRKKSDAEKKRVADSVFVDGSTHLVTSSQHGHIALVLYLVEMCGADVNKKADAVTLTLPFEPVKQAPALWYAAREGQLEVVQYLAKKSASIDAWSSRESSPLRAAAFAGYTEVVRHLVQCEADINLPDIAGSTPLHAACHRGHLKVVKELLSNPKMEINHLDNNGLSALFYASDQSHAEVVRMLLEAGAKQVPTETACPPLLTAANSGQIEIVRELIAGSQQQESDVNGVGEVPDEGIRLTPLLRAAASGQEEIVLYMIDPKNFSCCGYTLDDTERTEALLLLGAALISVMTYEEGRRKALAFWHLANTISKHATPLCSQLSKQSIVGTVLDIPEMHMAEENDTKCSIQGSMKLQVQAAVIFDKLVGPSSTRGYKHPQAGIRLFNLGTRLIDERGFCSAFELLKEGMKFLAGSLGPCHSRLAELYHAFARIFMSTIQEDKAVRRVKLEHVILVITDLLEVLRQGKSLLDSKAQMHTHADEQKERLTKNHQSLVLTLVQLVSIACSTLISSDSVNNELRDLADQAVELDLRGPADQTLLQIASSPPLPAGQFKHPNQPIIKFPCQCASLLLRCHPPSRHMVQESTARHPNQNVIGCSTQDIKVNKQKNYINKT